MLFKNDLFQLDGARHRLLHIEPETDRSWVIDVSDGYAWPVEKPWSAISGLDAEVLPSGPLKERVLTQPAIAARDKAMAALTPLLEEVLPLFSDASRFRLIKKHATDIKVSIPTLYKWLRRYWQNGQSPMALLPLYQNCGRSSKEITGGRGASTKSELRPFQLTDKDIEYFEEALKDHYWKDGRATLQDAYEALLDRRYSYLDGNGDSFILEEGDRPTYRQFNYYLKSHYSEEERLRRRKGDKDFALQDRGILGTILEDCLGVGHFYEADATIGDTYLVDPEDRQTIVGKPTVYLIVDRESRLIVGLYVGLENASWVCAKQAVLFISEDKQALCAKYGVEYQASDWPAHQVFPQSFLVDLGEWNSKGGEQLAKNLSVKVAFVPAKRADWKPVVESKNKQTRTTLQYGTPGFDPPENAKRRQGKHYEQDACLTLHEFTKLMLELIIKYNRTPLRNYPLTMAELNNSFLPTPINVWNRGIPKRSGVLTRYPADFVRQQLLARDTASVTEHGIEFRGCLYTTKTAIEKSWFVRARKERFKVEVSYDLRLVDNIYVFDPNGSGEPLLCELTSASEHHRGRSFAELAMYWHLEDKRRPELEQARLQAAADYRAATKPTVAGAKAALAAAQKAEGKKSRSGRRADTKPAREKARKGERQETGSLKTQQAAPAVQPPSAAVVDLGAHRAAQATQVGTAPVAPVTPQPTPPVGLSMAERTRLAMLKMKEQQS